MALFSGKLSQDRGRSVVTAPPPQGRGGGLDVSQERHGTVRPIQAPWPNPQAVLAENQVGAEFMFIWKTLFQYARQKTVIDTAGGIHVRQIEE